MSAAVIADRLLELRDLRYEDKILRADNCVKLLPDRLSKYAVLFAEIEQGDTHCRCNHGSFTCTINLKFRPVLPSVHLGARGRSAAIDLHQPSTYHRGDVIDPGALLAGPFPFFYLQLCRSL
jgi:hypothetical protein